MSIIKWKPYRNLISLPMDLDRFFSDFGLDFRNTDSVWSPVMDIVEKENGFEVKAELPGLSKDDIKISVEDNMLKLHGEKKYEHEDKNENYHRIERRYGKFQRNLNLPNGTKADDIKADYKNGILTINIPKSEELKPKEIAIK